MLRWVVLLLTLCSPGLSARYTDEEYNEEYNEEYYNGESRSLQYLFSVMDVHALTSAARQLLAESFTDLDEVLEEEFSSHGELRGANCPACRTGVSTLKTLIRQGLGYEDVRDQAISICVPIADGQGYLGDVICPGIVDNFGPEVVYVLNVTDAEYTAAEICTLYRACDAFHLNQPPPPSHAAAAESPKPRPARNYDDMIKIVHVTDVHVDEEYAEGSPSYCGLPVCCRDGYNGTGSGAYWGDYQCSVPPRTVESFLRQLAVHEPHAIMYTGDSPPHAIWEETQWGQIDVSRYVVDVLDQYFPDIPSYTALGNHDTFPVNMYGRQRPELLTEELNEALTSYWGPISRFGPEQIASFEYGGYFSSLLQEGLRVISYNSNYGTTENFFWLIPYGNGELQQMFHFLENEFELARQNNEKVILLGHHPTGGKGYFRVYEQFLYELTNTYGDLILLHFLGHNHDDKMQMTIDQESGEPRNVWLSIGSMGTKTNVNPTAKIFYLDPATLEPLDYDTYYLNLADTVDDPEVEPMLEFMFRASEEYGLADLSPAAYLDFIERMESDDDLFYRYRYNEVTRVRTPGACEDACRRNKLCDLRTMHSDHRAACKQAPGQL